jgi:muramoyltetrapeptide carboxypeptidase
MRMLKPRRLRPGDKVAVVAPASGFPREEFDRGLVELRNLGFEPVFEESVFARGHYVAGEGSVRAAAFLNAWRDPDVRAIVAVRGGYGSVHLLPYLSADVLRRDPKAFVGYSDLTSVLTHLTIGCGIVSFHGPMLDRRLGNGPAGYDRETFVRALTSVDPLGELMPPGLESFKQGEAEGVLVGGTLAQLVASLGTPYAFAPPRGHVLFLEDVSERPYRLDRMLTQLRFAGILALASAVVLGEFVGCDEPQGGPLARGTLAELFKDFQGPVIFGFPSGHTAGPSITLPFGVQARVVATGAPRLVIEETGVA